MTHALDVAFDTVAQAQFEGGIAFGHEALRLLQQLGRRLEAETYAACISANFLARAAEQSVHGLP